MKSFISILCPIISILFISSYGSSSKETETQINISCRECAGMEVSLTKSNILHTGLNEIYQSKFDSLGRTKIEFVQNDTLSLLVVVGNKDQGEWKFYTTLYFEPGANIDLTIENGSPKFDDDLKIINSYYHKIFLVEKERSQYVNTNVIDRISASSLEQQVYLDSLTQFGTELKHQIKGDSSISDYYRQMLLNYFSLYEITQRMHFDTEIARAESSNDDMRVVLDSTLTNAFEDLSLHPSYINNPHYTWYLERRLRPIFDNILNCRYDNEVKTGVYEYVKGAIIKDKKLNDYREFLMALFVAHMSIDYLMDYNLELKLIDLFQKDYPHSKYLEGLKYIVTNYDELKPGMPMKDLVLHDINEKEFKLSDLSGNLVYIDIWATWCGPCVDELKYSVKLSKKYSSRPDLKFLYISVDQQTEKWRRFLRNNLQIEGLHGIQNSEFLADSNIVNSLYKFNAIPRYILIDKDGNIVTTNAKIPSELLSDNYLDSLLAI
ncbi:TlpA family protein disulfide reductase [Persicitalea sp.]|uniref:TlpA family protein disulfide reductase n=1 Tax=Persicitalea sp. TaxID=3100273 RepID=UPI0035933ED9